MQTDADRHNGSEQKEHPAPEVPSLPLAEAQPASPPAEQKQADSTPEPPTAPELPQPQAWLARFKRLNRGARITDWLILLVTIANVFVAYCQFGAIGDYISVEPFHLFRYLDEQAFRFNERTLNDAERFSLAITGIVGKRLMYQDLIGALNAGAPA